MTHAPTPALLLLLLALFLSTVPLSLGADPTSASDFTLSSIHLMGDTTDQSLAVVAGTNQTAYACMPEDDTIDGGGGMYLSTSTDGGASWSTATQVDDDAEDDDTCAISVFNETHIALVWRAADGFNGATCTGGGACIKAAVSTDSGSSFTVNEVDNPATRPAGLDIDWINSTIVGVLEAKNDDTLHYHESTDLGNSWTTKGNAALTTPGKTHIYGTFHNVPGTTDTLLWYYHSAGDPRFAKSTDRGTTWNLHDLNVTGTDWQTKIPWQPVDTTTFIAAGIRSGGAATDGAYFLESTDGGDTWTEHFAVERDNLGGTAMDMDAADAQSWAFAYQQDPTNTTSPCTNGECVRLLYTTDGGSSFTETFASTTATCDECGDMTSLAMLNSESYTIGTLNATGTDDEALILNHFTGQIPAGVEVLDHDTTINGFSDLQELRTSHSANSPTIWTRERDNGGTQRLYRFDRTLTQTGAAQICGGTTDFTNNFLPSVASFGLAVTAENQPIFPCVRALPDATSLHLADSTGTWEADDAFVVLEGKRTAHPIDARTANRVTTLDATSSGNPAVVQVDLLTLQTDREGWDADDVSTSYGDELWIAYTGPTGTKVVNNVNGVPVAPAIANAFDSVQLHDTSLWVANQDSDELRRYTVVPGNALSLEQTISWDTDSTHALRVSKDGRYLAVRGPSNYTVFNASTLTQLGTTNGTIDPAGFDMDANNNYLYGIVGPSQDEIRRWPIFNITTNAQGDAGLVGQENPPATSDPLEETATGDTTDPTGVEDDEGLGSFATAEAADAFGVSQTAAGWILAAMTVLGMTVVAGTAGGALVSIQAAEKFALAGIVAGLAISVGFGWIPLWFLAVMGLVSAAVIVTRGGG